MSKYCEAVELLLARMESFPEEFTEGGRWERLMLKYRTYLSTSDRMALEDKINAIRRDAFHKDVMYELLAKPSEDAGVDSSIYLNASPTGGIAVSPYSNSANINLSSQSIKDIAAQLQSYASNTWKP